MIFRRRQDTRGKKPGSSRMRGRGDAENPQNESTGQADNPLARRFMAEDEPDTIDLEEPARFRREDDQTTESAERNTRDLAGDSGPDIIAASGEGEEPVCGFLVVIEGPGRGSFLALHYGRNSLGRDTDESVSLDFGDSGISYRNHCVITYDSVSRRFFIQPGAGSQLTHIGKTPVLAPAELEQGVHILVGSTVLRFVPLCGEDFDWNSSGLPDTG